MKPSARTSEKLNSLAALVAVGFGLFLSGHGAKATAEGDAAEAALVQASDDLALDLDESAETGVPPKGISYGDFMRVPHRDIIPGFLTELLAGLDDPEKQSYSVAHKVRGTVKRKVRIKGKVRTVSQRRTVTVRRTYTQTTIPEWSFEFVYVTKDGEHVTLSSYQPDKLLEPASTIKLFTAYYRIKDPVASCGEDLMRTMLFDSNNAYAEGCIDPNGPGAYGSRARGSALEMIDFYRKLDPVAFSAADFSPVNGSGYRGGTSGNHRAESRKSLVRISAGTRLLATILHEGDYNTIQSRMPDPTRGTYGPGKNRPQGRNPQLAGQLQVKTGTLPNSGVSGLIGFVRPTGMQGTLIFYILSDRAGGKARVLDSKALEDSLIVTHLDELKKLGLK